MAKELKDKVVNLEDLKVSWDYLKEHKVGHAKVVGNYLYLYTDDTEQSQIGSPILLPSGGEGGTSDHNQLINRGMEDQHPIAAITGLVEGLAAKVDDTDIVQVSGQNADKVMSQKAVTDSLSGVIDAATEAIGDEAAVRAAADNQLQSNISAEATARQDADALLQPKTDTTLETESTTIVGAINEVRANLEQEGQTRSANDNAILNELDTKVDKVAAQSGNPFLYGRKSIEDGGTEGKFTMDAGNASANTVVQRNGNGQICTASPTANNHATPKKYADDLYHDAQTTVTQSPTEIDDYLAVILKPNNTGSEVTNKTFFNTKTKVNPKTGVLSSTKLAENEVLLSNKYVGQPAASVPADYVPLSNGQGGYEWGPQSGSGGTSDYEQLINKPSINDVVISGNKTGAQLGLQDTISDLATIRSGASLGATAIQEETDPTVPSWAKQSSKPTYTAAEVGALPATTVIPTKTSQLTNDSGFLTQHQDISGKVDKVTGSSLVPDTKVAAYDAHIINKSNPHEVTKAQVGLGNVDNTSDANKPISTAMQSALDEKVDKISGKGLSTNDYTTAEKTKLSGLSQVTESTVAGWGFTKNAGTYVKPSTGIPASDLATAVQEILNNVSNKIDKPVGVTQGKVATADGSGGVTWESSTGGTRVIISRW